MMDNTNLKSDCWGLWEHRGFLPSRDPMTHLREWPEIDRIIATTMIDTLEAQSKDLEPMLRARNVRSSLGALPLLNLEPLRALGGNNHLIERLVLLYSNFANAYIFETPEDPGSVLPKNLAVPLFELTRQVGRKPILSYASYIHYNWRRVDPAQGIVLENLELNQELQGGIHEKWFVLVHVEIEAIASNMLQSIMAYSKRSEHCADALSQALREIKDGVDRMIVTFNRMDENCTPYDYYHQVRPYIFGFDDVDFEGVEAGRQNLRGQAASQSSIIPSLVSFLGICHPETSYHNHLEDTRKYMPVEHQVIISDLSKARVREFVEAEGRKNDLAEHYNIALKAISDFRSSHLENVRRYITEFSQDEEQLGTGKTVFLKWLKKLRDETNASLITV